MSYASIDPVIERWVQAHALVLLTEFGGEERRLWYTSREDECFQISIAPPADTGVTVHAWAIETDDDAELHGEWTVDPKDLKAALTTATALIDLWATRVRLTE